jgi:eukaryotic-like serine/threonine-protein kinase
VNPDLSEPKEEQFADLLAAGDEALAAGDPTRADAGAATPHELRERLELRLAFAQQVRRALRPRRDLAAAGGFRVGAELGDYRIIREIGRGGMGVVYEAEQLSLGRRVALKVLPFAVAPDGRQLQRFKNEAQAAAQLHHAHIVPVYAVGCAGGVHYYAMQYIEGRTLAGLIADLRRLSGLEPGAAPARSETGTELARELITGHWAPTRNRPTEGQPVGGQHADPAAGAGPARELEDTPLNKRHPVREPVYFRTIANLGLQAAEALEYAHQIGVVHRDIKPANLMVDESGHLWVADFGLARVQTDAPLTETGDILGTLRYMSPEQAQARRGMADPAADIYSLGATLYELLTLQPAFPGDDRAEVLRRLLWDEPRQPRRLNPSIPADLETVVLKAMTKEPAGRYAAAQHLAEDLRSFLEDRPIRARRPTVVERSRRWARRHRPAVVAGIVMLVAAFAASAVAAVAITRERADAALHREARAREADFARERDLQARRHAYLWDLLAFGHEPRKDPGYVQQMLARHLPSEGQEDVRGFEWHLLRRLWQGDSEARLVLGHHAGEVYHVTFAPDGRTFATAGADGTARLCDAATGAELRAFRGHTNEVNWVAFAPDGNSLVSASDDGTARVWDVASGKTRGVFNGHKGAVVCALFLADGRSVISGGLDRTLRIWDAAESRELRALEGAPDRIDAMALSQDGRLLAMASGPTQVANLWDLATGKERFAWPSKGRVFGVAFAPDGKSVATGNGDGSVQIYSVARGTHLQTITGHSHAVLAVAWGPAGDTIATASDDNTVRHWHVRTGTPLNIFTGYPSRAWCVAYAPDGRTLATTGRDGTVRIWEPSRTRPVIQLGDGLPATLTLAMAPDRPALATGHTDGAVRIWDLAARRMLTELRGHNHSVTALAWSADGRLLASSGDWTIRLWDVAAGRERLVVPDLEGWDLAFTSDGRLAICGEDDRARRGVFWHDVAGGARVGAWQGDFCSLAYSSEGGTLAAGCMNGAGVFWRRPDGNQRGPVKGHLDLIRRMAFAPDGKSLATAGSGGTVKLWDAATGAERLQFFGHEGIVLALAFSPDGRTLATGGEDKTVRLWELVTGRELLRLSLHTGPVNGVAFTPDGRSLVTTGHDDEGPGAIYLWPQDPPPV